MSDRTEERIVPVEALADLATLTLRRGDVLVVRPRRELPLHRLECLELEVRDAMKRAGLEGVGLLLLEECEVGVLRRELKQEEEVGDG